MGQRKIALVGKGTRRQCDTKVCDRSSVRELFYREAYLATQALVTGPSSKPALEIQAGDPVGEVAQKLIADLCTEMSARYGTPPSPFSPSEAAAARTVFLIARLGG